MGLTKLENAILDELKEVTNNPRLRYKDVIEWSTGKLTNMQGNETEIRLPRLGINCAVLSSALNKP